MPHSSGKGKIEIYDTTLRDGMQGEGMSLSADEKLRFAHRLDQIGFDLIEAGFPSSNPKELELFELLERENFTHAQIVAFGMTRRRDLTAADDPGLQVLANCFAPVCTVVGKTWDLHLEKVVKVDREENLKMIADSVAFLVAEGKRVIYDAEHFFDAYRSSSSYALNCLRVALEAGAECLTLCDTNGSSLPEQISEATAAAITELGEGARVGIHCHNDAECGVANSLAAVQAGAVHVQGTVNGYGERCGNANLISIVPNLQLKLDYSCISDQQLTQITALSHFADELCNVSQDHNQAYVGKNAFAHKGGMHVAGVAADASTFEHIEPQLVGNHRDVLISELSGKGTIKEKAQELGLNLSDEQATKVLEQVKDLEHLGYHFEAADASFELLLRRADGSAKSLFTLESWRVIVEKRADGVVATEATVKVWLDDNRYVYTAEGNGPVNALDGALRAAILRHYPQLEQIELVNFKVRILDETKGTDAVTRVLIDASNGSSEWGSIGVSENIIEASWEALVDSLQYGIQPGTLDS